MRLECYLGTLVHRWNGHIDPAGIPPRTLARMILRPEKLFRGLSRHQYVARMVFKARLAELELGEEEATTALVDRPAIPVEPASFRLEQLTDRQIAAVATALGYDPRKSDADDPLLRIQVEARLGVLLEAWLRRRRLEAAPEASSASVVQSVSARVLRGLLRRPARMLRGSRALLRRAEAIAHERWLAEGRHWLAAETSAEVTPTPIEPIALASARLRREEASSVEASLSGAVPIDVPESSPASAARHTGLHLLDSAPRVQPNRYLLEVDPGQEKALHFRLEQLSAAQRRVVGRWLLRTGRRCLEGPEVIEIESRLGVLLDRSTGGGDPSSVSPRAVGRLLTQPQRVLRGIGFAHYVAGLVAQERRRRIDDGRDKEPAAFSARRSDVLLSPGAWIAMASTGLASLSRPAIGPLSQQLGRLPLARAARRLSRRMDAEAADDRRWLTLLSLLVASQLARFVSVQFFGRPAESVWYEQDAPLFVSWLRQGDLASRVGVSVLTLLLVLTPWRSFGEPWVRRVVAGVILALLLSSLLVAPNPYFQSAFSADRLALAALGAASVLHPAAVPSFLAEYRLVHQQLRFPELTPYPYLHYRFLQLPLELLIAAFLVFAVLHTLMRGKLAIANQVLLMLLALIVVGYYVDWAWQLVQLGPTPWAWFRHDDLGDAAVAAWLSGWLTSLPESVLLLVAGALDAASPFLLPAFALAIGGAVAAFFDRRVAALAFLALAVAHLGYFAVSGVFLWGPFVATAGLAVLLAFAPPSFDRAFGVLPGFVFAAVALFFPRPRTDVDLARWDTRVIETVKIELVGSTEGKTRTVWLSPSWIAPYDRLLSLQLGLVEGPWIDHRGTTKHLRVAQLARRASADTEERDRLLLTRDGRGMAGSWNSRVHVLEPFDELLRRALDRDVHPAVAAWRRYGPSSVNPFGPRPPVPDLEWREARLHVVAMLRSRSGIELLADDVVHTVDLSGSATETP
jgi:hypothetical protein